MLKLRSGLTEPLLDARAPVSGNYTACEQRNVSYSTTVSWATGPRTSLPGSVFTRLTEVRWRRALV